MYIKKEIGNIGEEIAVKYLQQEEYIIINRNFKCKQGEIDIIAKDLKKGELVFIEVKTRRNYNYGNPSEAVDERKQKHIYRSAEYYVYKYNIKNIPIRFDVMEIKLSNGKWRIEHIKKAFIKKAKI